MTHAHLTSTRGFLDGELTIDGERFPHPVLSISYRLDNDHQFPTLTVEFSVDRLTIDHSYKYEPETKEDA